MNLVLQLLLLLLQLLELLLHNDCLLRQLGLLLGMMRELIGRSLLRLCRLMLLVLRLLLRLLLLLLRLLVHVEIQRVWGRIGLKLVEKTKRFHVVDHLLVMIEAQGWTKSGRQVEALLERSLSEQTRGIAAHVTLTFLLHEALDEHSLSLLFEVVKGAFARGFNLRLCGFERLGFTGTSSRNGPHLDHKLSIVSLEVLVAKDDWIIWSNTTIDTVCG